MEVTKTKNTVFERIRKPSVFAKSAAWEWVKFFIGSVIASFLTYLLISSILPDEWFNQTFLNILIALLFGASLTFLFFSVFFYYENNKAFMYLHQVKTKGRDIFNKNQKIIFKILKDDYNALLYNLVKLPNEQVKSTYTNQIKIASIFNNLAQDKFWATSFDLPSQFYAKNKDYFNAMNNLSKINGEYNTIPKKARVFICSLDEFIEDIYHNPQNLTDLIKWHLYWHKKSSRGATNSPIRFLLYDNKSKTEILDTYFVDKLESENTIPDFMVVDQKFVYGRIENKSIEDNNVTLRAIASTEYKRLFPFGKYFSDRKTLKLIKTYELIFDDIYQNAIEPLQIVDLLNYELEEFSDRLKEIDNDLTIRENKPFSSQSYRLEKEIIEGIKTIIKAEIETTINDYNNIQDKNEHYLNLFRNSLNGYSFTNKWLELMKKSTDQCFAIDNADSRGGKTRFLDKWNSDALYKEFLNASSTAVKKNNAKFTRIFILDEKINENDQFKFHSFIRECVSNFNIDVGIVLLTDLIDKQIITDQSIQTMADFVLLNIKDTTNLNTNEVLGFKISKSNKFDYTSLNYYNNLVLPTDFKGYYTLFETIYSESTKFLNATDVDKTENISKFINKKETL